MSSIAGSTWSGTHRFAAPRLVEARSIEEVQRVVAAGGPMRALGTRHSFNDLADTEGTLVTVTGIDPDIRIDADAGTVTAGAGIRYAEVAAAVGEAGWALHNLGSLPHISIGGATATGTHGSGDRNGNLSTAIRAIEYVDHRGELVTARRGDPDFEALPVGLGAYGIVVRLTLDLQPGYLVRQDVYAGLPWSTVLSDLDSVTGAGYSVSLFTRDWAGETVPMAWVKRRLDVDGVPDAWLGAHRRAEQVPIFDLPDPNVTLQGRLGPWYEGLPHFRVDSTPSAGAEIQSEWFVGRGDAPAAIEAVQAVAGRIAPVLQVSEIRTIAADELWLSEAYQRDSVALHFTWADDAEGVARAVDVVEEAIAPFGARPHWGKVHHFDAAAIARVVPRAADARRVFERLDPDGVFAGPALRRLGLR
ncbi:FAD-binding protein [Pseudolysinimonas kribbensis]|uniref:Xylitol oxidase n=1 Tax=Pseudolysinimonas kribbensis TaxID=433641 RepID=A0ABQ6K2Y8_9MICO|nr:FAD-binding protein [Pseudolysinimonas kribbensis]GMA94993.1 xylitol oxidase [Pseudolysinimonas kribbensis]